MSKGTWIYLKSIEYSHTIFPTGSAPGTPMSPGFPGGLSFPKQVEEKVDHQQEFIRARQKEAEENKRRLMKAYDYVSRTGAGPKTILVEELSRIDSKYCVCNP